MSAVQWAVLVVSAAVWGLVGAPSGALAYDVDQSHTPEIFGQWSIGALAPVGQEFVPAFPLLDVVAFWIDHGSVGTEQPADVFVRVRAGTIDGTLLGRSGTVRVEEGLFAPVEFVFAEPVALTPGAVHVLEICVEPGGGNPLVGGSFDEDYPLGRAILEGTPFAADYWFRTGATEGLPGAAWRWGGVKAAYR